MDDIDDSIAPPPAEPGGPGPGLPDPGPAPDPTPAEPNPSSPDEPLVPLDSDLEGQRPDAGVL